MRRVWVGCSGWNYPHWREAIYPKGLPARRWLEHYATLFDTVEVNNTFYRLASRDAVADWVVEEPPFVGLGFTPDPDSVVREYRVSGVELPHGAEVWELDDDGAEHRRAVLDGDVRAWVVP